MAIELGSGEFYSRTANLPGQTAATLIAWFNSASIAAGYDPLMALFRNADGQEIAIAARAGSDLELYWQNGGGSASAGTSTLGLAANTWFCVAITCAGLAIGDVVLRARVLGSTAWMSISNTSTNDANVPDRLYLNTDGYGSGTDTHRVANWKVWDRVLTEDELTAEMYSLFPVALDGLNLWAPLWDAATDTTDFSGNARTLTLTGTEATATNAPPISDSISLLPFGHLIPAGVATQDILPSGIASAGVFGSQTIANVVAQPLAPGGIGTASVYGSHTVADIVLAVAPAGLGSAAVFGDHLVEGPGQTIQHSGLGSAAVFGSHTVAIVVNQVLPAGIASAAVFGTHLLVEEVVSFGIPSAAVYGSHTLLGAGLQFITPPGRASAAVFGSHTLASVAARTIAPSGIPSAAVFGTHSIADVLSEILPSGVPSAVRFGGHVLAGGTPYSGAVGVERRRRRRPVYGL